MEREKSHPNCVSNYSFRFSGKFGWYVADEKLYNLSQFIYTLRESDRFVL